MKTCYVIQSKEEFIGDNSRPIRTSNWKGRSLTVADCEENAKHYAKKAIPTNWIKRSNKSLNDDNDAIGVEIEQYNNNKNNKNTNSGNYYDSWRIDAAKNRRKQNIKILTWLKSAKVVEIGVEQPNYEKDFKLRYRDSGDTHSSDMKLCTTGSAQSTCRACRVVLKNIPYYEFTRQTGKVCVACLFIRQEAIKSAFEGMPQEFQDEFVGELVLGSM
tara:strand:+ start:850 stop:1497 length:648 start_codon:yes stop_codon:yes gene_type:complete